MKEGIGGIWEPSLRQNRYDMVTGCEEGVGKELRQLSGL